MIGYVETLVEVDESDGQATLTVNISVPAPDSILRFWIMFRLDATMMNITAGMGNAPQFFNHFHIIVIHFYMSRTKTSFIWPV